MLVRASVWLWGTYVADTPGDCAFLARGGGLVGLAFNAKVHDVVTANGAVVHDDIPRPESDRIPLRHVSTDVHMLPCVVWCLPS